MAKNLITKDNTLINASYSLDLVEQRLILLAIVEARKSNFDLTISDEITINAKTYSEQFKTTIQGAYIALKDASKTLFERQFTYQKLNENKKLCVMTSRWVSGIGYVEEEAKIIMRFSQDIIPFVTRLESHFTSYELEQVSGLKSAYAVRLYELLIAWKSTQKLSIKLQDLRCRLGVSENELKRIQSFKMRVLDIAIKQINEKTNLTVKYEQHKAGRTIIGFTFTFKEKPEAISKKKFENQQKHKKKTTRKSKTTEEKLTNVDWATDDWLKKFED